MNPNKSKSTGAWNTPGGVLDEIWKMLRRGADRFNDPFHWPVLGTTGKTGPALRSVILRQVIVSERTLICHTDARSGKVNEIRHAAQVCWHFYHPKRKVQLRLSGPAVLHTDNAFADEQWAASKITHRLNYCAHEPPGTPVDRPSSGLPDLLLNKLPTLLETERGRKNFMVIACRIDSIDWLVLGVLGNRRARFAWDENGLTSTWLIP